MLSSARGTSVGQSCGGSLVVVNHSVDSYLNDGKVDSNTLNSDLNSCKQLIYLLNERHSHCVRYIQALKRANERLAKRVAVEGQAFGDHLFDESSCESDLSRCEKQINSLQQQLFKSFNSNHYCFVSNKQSVQTQTTGAQPVDGVIHKGHTKSNANDSNGDANGKYRCDYYGCNQWFAHREQMDVHLRVHNSMHESMSAIEQSFNGLYGKHNTKDVVLNTRLNDAIGFVPQIELQIIEYSNGDNNALEALSYVTNEDSTGSRVGTANNPSADRSHINCDICGKQFSKHYILSHRRSHTGVKPYKCSYGGCERAFTQTSSRNYHEKTYHRIDKYALKCYYSNCHKAFVKQIDLQKHLSLHNRCSDGQLFNAGAVMASTAAAALVSGGTTSQLVLNDSHVMRQVVKTRKLRRVPHRSGKHGCAHCGKTFAHKVALRQHEVIHGTKQFACTYAECKYASYWKQNLALHLRRHHSQP